MITRNIAINFFAIEITSNLRCLVWIICCVRIIDTMGVHEGSLLPRLGEKGHDVHLLIFKSWSK